MALGIYEEEEVRAIADAIRLHGDFENRERKYTTKEMGESAIQGVHANGHRMGYSEGITAGYDRGFDEGRNEGYAKAVGEVEMSIKSAIEEKGVEVADGTPIREYPTKIDAVYEAGKKSEYDAFWDAYQDNGKPKSYKCAFGGYGWTPEIFRPKHNLIVTNANYMFSTCTRIKGIDLEQHFKELGITFDTSGVTGIDGFDYFCQYASPSVVPVIDTRGTEQIRYIFFHTSELVTVRKVILKDDGSQKFTNPFPNNSKLENIEFEGAFGNAFDISGSPKLTKKSITSIVNTLFNTASDKSVTLSKTAVNNAFETSQGLSDGSTSEEWLALIATKNNWTISLN